MHFYRELKFGHLFKKYKRYKYITLFLIKLNILIQNGKIARSMQKTIFNVWTKCLKGKQCCECWLIVHTKWGFSAGVFAASLSRVFLPLCPGSAGVDGDVEPLGPQPPASDQGRGSGRADGSGSQLQPLRRSLLFCPARAHEGSGWDLFWNVITFICVCLEQMTPIILAAVLRVNADSAS